jgi:isoleucyl-tRNA synthetase
MIDMLCDALLKWLAPILPFTCDEAWIAYRPDGAPSVHLLGFPENLASWRDDALAEKWRKVRLVRRVVTGALEIERAAKRIGSSLEAAPVIYIADPELGNAVAGVDMAEVSITSAATIVGVDEGQAPSSAFRLDDIAGVAVDVRLAEGKKCARSWKILPTVGSDPDYPDVSPRDAQALREWDALRRAAE